MTFPSICSIFHTDSLLSRLVFYLFLSHLSVYGFASLTFQLLSDLLRMSVSFSTSESVYLSVDLFLPHWLLSTPSGLASHAAHSTHALHVAHSSHSQCSAGPSFVFFDILYPIIPGWWLV